MFLNVIRYYPPFEGAIAADVGSFMCSYNKINAKSVTGTGWSCENPETLQRDLKDRLGFKGWVMSDWGATHSMSIMAGLDQEMPGSSYMGDDAIAKAVQSGSVPDSRVVDAALRILTPLFAVGVFDRNNTNTQLNNVTSPGHQALARSPPGRLCSSRTTKAPCRSPPVRDSSWHSSGEPPWIRSLPAEARAKSSRRPSRDRMTRFSRRWA